MRSLAGLALVLTAILLSPSCTGPGPTLSPPAAVDPDDLLVVDCLLPGEIRKLGSKLVFAGPRRPVKTSAVDCEVRGGEYVAYDRADYRTALAVWQSAAEAGDPEAQNYVGEIYEKGLGVAPDHALAAHWYRQAAEQGFPRAQTNLGQLYDRGMGVPRDPKAALAWYGRASGLEQARVPFLPAAMPSAENEALTQQLAERTRELDALREELRRLGTMDAQLDAERVALDEERRHFDQERERLAGERAGLERERVGASVSQDELKRRANALAEAEAAIAAREDALGREAASVAERERSLEKKRGELAALRKDLAKLRREATQAPPPPSLDAIELPGPSIELIEPPLPLVRGVQLVAAAAGDPGSDRLIVGRVDAPAGLMGFTSNTGEIAVDGRGLFRTSIRVPAAGVTVRLAAIDRRGKRAERELRLEGAATPATTPPPPAPRPSVDFGSYHALVIGNDDYQALPDLRTARNDARALASLLEGRYGFRVELLLDATRYQILSALNELRSRLTERDNLLVYYAGHGELDEVNSRGHWLPVDAEPTSNANWISNVAITDVLNAMAARHVLVIADSCYSGSLTRSSLARLEAGMTEEAREAWMRAMVTKRSRTALTSGGLQPVLDSGGGGRHSIFARILLEVLEANRDVLEGQRLFQEVSARVTWVAEGTDFEQVPQYAPLRFAGHESGEFFLVPSS